MKMKIVNIFNGVGHIMGPVAWGPYPYPRLKLYWDPYPYPWLRTRTRLTHGFGPVPISGTWATTCQITLKYPVITPY